MRQSRDTPQKEYAGNASTKQHRCTGSANMKVCNTESEGAAQAFDSNAVGLL